jgi:alkylhydroperoxidase family enzyme
MTNPLKEPRIAPLPAGAEDERAAELLAGVPATGFAVNIFRTLVRHPGLYRHWLPFGGKLLAGKLPARHRELAILRTAWCCQSDYEWGQHVPIAQAAGVTDEEIARVPRGADAAGWTAIESAILRAVDELHADSRISDATWTVLAGEYEERQLIEVPMLIGHYHLVAFTLNSLGVQREPGVVGLPGAP